MLMRVYVMPDTLCVESRLIAVRFLSINQLLSSSVPLICPEEASFERSYH